MVMWFPCQPLRDLAPSDTFLREKKTDPYSYSEREKAHKSDICVWMYIVWGKKKEYMQAQNQHQCFNGRIKTEADGTRLPGPRDAYALGRINQLFLFL